VLTRETSGGIDLPVWLQAACPLNSRQIKSTTYNTPPVNHIIRVNPSTTPLPALQVQSLSIGEDDAGQRLDNYLMRHLKGVPKTHIYRIIRSGEVRINKGRAHADSRLNAGDVVRVPPVRTSERAAEKTQAMAAMVAQHHPIPARDFAILFEDDHLIAINKPAGIAVHGGSGVSFGVIEQLRMARPKAQFLELVHRLDRETSGILLVAKKRSALKSLQDQFRERQTGKVYLALVLGQWPANKRVLDRPLHKFLLENGERRVRVTTADNPDAMPSLTLVKVRAVGEVQPDITHVTRAYSLLEVTIKTGRTHQIRVHLANEGMPIAGDDKYGDFDCNKALAKVQNGVPLKRMFLHAWNLRCRHPATEQPLVLEAPLPVELAQFLTQTFTTPATTPATPSSSQP
jgi:23S rRNA pseudouridine955/2504/2580 synthase